MDAAQLRNLVKEVSGRDISTAEATAVLTLFKDDLDSAINQANRDFVAKHFGKRTSSQTYHNSSFPTKDNSETIPLNTRQFRCSIRSAVHSIL